MNSAAARSFNSKLQAIFDGHKGFGDDSKLNSLALVNLLFQASDHSRPVLISLESRAGSREGSQKRHRHSQDPAKVSVKLATTSGSSAQFNDCSTQAAWNSTERAAIPATQQQPCILAYSGTGIAIQSKDNLTRCKTAITGLLLDAQANNSSPTADQLYLPCCMHCRLSSMLARHREQRKNLPCGLCKPELTVQTCVLSLQHSAFTHTASSSNFSAKVKELPRVTAKRSSSGTFLGETARCPAVLQDV